MENIINSVKNLIGTYGFGAATVIVLTIIVVNLIKKPILARAEKLAKQRGYDKAVLTRYVTYLPFVVSLVLTLFWRLFASGFDFAGTDWGGLLSSSVLYAAVAIATYESVKVNLRAYASKKNVTEAEASEPAAAGESVKNADTDGGKPDANSEAATADETARGTKTSEGPNRTESAADEPTETE